MKEDFARIVFLYVFGLFLGFIIGLSVCLFITQPILEGWRFVPDCAPSCNYTEDDKVHNCLRACVDSKISGEKAKELQHPPFNIHN